VGAKEEQGEGVVLRRPVVLRRRRERRIGGNLRSGGLLALSPRPLTAQLVDEAARGDGDEPRPWVLRDTLLRPLQRPCEQRLLHGVLAGVEPAVAANEHAEDLRRERAQLVLDLSPSGHTSEAVMCMIGRTSTAK